MLKKLSKKHVIIISVILLLIAAVIIYLVFMRGEAKNPLSRTNEPVRSQLTGLETNDDEAKRPILSVMIENSEAARPQTGLDKAGIVFEAVTEGGITRFLALYQTDTPDTVGPVRSLRSHFLDWAMGFDASIAHVGGSPQALQTLSDRDGRDLDETANEDSYYRDNSREAPHNAYARTTALRTLQSKLEHSTSKFDPIPRKADSPPIETATVATISLNFSTPEFLAEFRYDKASNSYTRYLAGQLHIDQETGKPITVKNVIVLLTSIQDSTVEATGEDQALVFSDGVVREATWRQTDHEERLKLFEIPAENATDTSEKELALNRGDSWFAALPARDRVTY